MPPPTTHVGTEMAPSLLSSGRLTIGMSAFSAAVPFVVDLAFRVRTEVIRIKYASKGARDVSLRDATAEIPARLVENSNRSFS
jgi:hypothetical protein